VTSPCLESVAEIVCVALLQHVVACCSVVRHASLDEVELCMASGSPCSESVADVVYMALLYCVAAC